MTSGSSVKSEWVGWIRRGHALIIEYTFTGAMPDGQEAAVQIDVTVERGPFGTHKFFNFFVKPDLGYPECYLLAGFQSITSSETTGFMPVRAAPVPGNATLLNIKAREDADKMFQMLCLGKDMIFVVRDNKEEILRLPLHNDAGFLTLYTEIAKSLMVAG